MVQFPYWLGYSGPANTLSWEAASAYLVDKTVRRSSNKLCILAKEQDNTNILFESHWNLNENLNLPNGRILSLAQVSTKDEFICKLQQHEITVKLGSHGAKAKKIFQKYAVPSWERINYPLIYANGRLVGIAGLWTSARF